MITLGMGLKVFRLYLVLIFILILHVCGIHATYGQKMIIAIKAGATASKNTFSEKADRDEFSHLWKPGFSGAVIINFPLKKSFSFQAETGFSSRGRKIEFNNGSWHNHATYHFIDASMMVRKSFPINRKGNASSALFITVGPQMGYWLNGKGKVNGVDQFDYQVKFEKQPDNPATPDFGIMYLTDVNRKLYGLNIGVGIDAPTLFLQRFMVELRYTFGMTQYGERNSAYNATSGFTDNLRSNENTIVASVAFALNRDSKEAKKGKPGKTIKPRKNFDSLLR